jgi:hypothetical protein
MNARDLKLWLSYGDDYKQITRDKKKILKKMSHEELRAHIRKNPIDIQLIKRPTVDLQTVAVEEDSSTLTYIVRPDETVQRLAVCKFAFNISRIRNPPTDLQRLAVERDPRALAHIRRPSPLVQILAFQKDGNVFHSVESSKISKIAKLYWKYKYGSASAHQRLETLKNLWREAKKNHDIQEILEQEGVFT